MAQRGTLLSYFNKVAKPSQEEPTTPKNVLTEINNNKTSPTTENKKGKTRDGAVFDS